MKPAYKNKRNDKYQGGKRFGSASSPWKRKSFDRGDRREMFDATCTECGNDCQVPFRPNGSKPVKCHNCFKRDGDSFDRGGSFQKHERRPAPAADTSKIEARLGAIESKLDELIEALTAIGEDEAKKS